MTHDDGSTCGKKVMGPRSSCCFCRKIIHLTTACTEFDQESIEVLAKLDHNLLHICNSCTGKKKNFLKTDTSSDSKIDSQMEALQQQMKLLSQKIEDPNDQVSDVKKKRGSLKKLSTSFREAHGNVIPGRSVSVPNKADKATLGVNF